MMTSLIGDDHFRLFVRRLTLHELTAETYYHLDVQLN